MIITQVDGGPAMQSLAPTASPTSAPTVRRIPTPGAVYTESLVDSNHNTERVRIPQPPLADMAPNTNQINCPHLEGSFTDGSSFFSRYKEWDDVRLSPDTRILVTESILTRLGTVTIPPSSELIFGENVAGISMDVRGIDVQGSLIAGSETCRLQTQLTITLHGSRQSTPQTVLYKGIGVTGTLSLHGKRFYRTWTR